MPRPRRSNLGRHTRRNQDHRRARSQMTQEEIEANREAERLRAEQLRNTPGVQDALNEGNRLRRETEQRSPVVTQRIQEHRRVSRRATVTNMHRVAFEYDSTADYGADARVNIGEMTNVCPHCNAVKFTNETSGLCCASGKVKLEPLHPPAEPLRALFDGVHPHSNEFLKNILAYNNIFIMTSFGAKIIKEGNYMPTCKVTQTQIYSNDDSDCVEVQHNTPHCTTINQHFLIRQIHGQVFHRIGALAPFPNEQEQYLQVYFLPNNDQLNLRDGINQRLSLKLKREVLHILQNFVHENNSLVEMFKTAAEDLPSDDHSIIIRADRTPAGEHERRYNAPTISEVGAIVVGDQANRRDIVLRRRNNTLQCVSETHRLYDALQYPLLYWQGQDGYDITLKMVNPITGKMHL